MQRFARSGNAFRSLTYFLLALLSLAFMSCSAADGTENVGAVSRDSDAFADYWYAGKAELVRYRLEQARYGDIHDGEAVLIFVTEPFLTDKQVKHEYGESENRITVLKLNFTRKFYTGIYAYSVMTSVFTPVSLEEFGTLKVTSTAQEWCGQMFMQFNAREDRYAAQLRSYFQREGDRNFELPRTLLEDEIWTRIRLAPDQLPTGDIRIIPGTQFVRFRHVVPLKVEDAHASLTTTTDEMLSEAPLKVYTIDYADLERTLVIIFEDRFPYKIVAWEEKHKSGFGGGAQVLTTRAVKTHELHLDYWNKNSTSDAHYREKLGVEF